jgi:hypothetical protein
MQNQNNRKKQNCDDLKNKIDFSFNEYDEIDVHSTRYRRLRNVKSENRYIADIFLLFFDFVSKNWECFEKHHAFKNKQLRNRRNHKKRTLSKNSKKKTCRHRQVNKASTLCKLLTIKSVMRSTCWEIDQIRESSSSSHSRKRQRTRKLNSRSSSEIVFRTAERRQKTRKTKNYDDAIDFIHIAIQRAKWKKRNDDNFLINSRIEDYDLSIIQKSWRNVYVFTLNNAFNIDFHLLYQKLKNVCTCFYVNFRLNAHHWFVIFASKNICFFQIRTANNRWINVHNVYNVSFNLYMLTTTLFVVETIKWQLKDEKKHIILKNFNLHHFLWSDFAKSTQHDATNQLLNVVH